ncbi:MULTISPECIES: peptidoglycan-binding domain-containing protein [Streptomyces]|uniref:peptidoglycan-binding domain-containing protein n=1 Tax=Streptomyces TaxID=1883 RepID=UPI000B017407|nr:MULTISPECIES: peptidoglycan-binding domain-containing protein [Streptomyces]
MTAHLCPVCGLERTRADGLGCDCAGRAASAAGDSAPPPHEPSTRPSPRPAGGLPSGTTASGEPRDGEGGRGPEEGGSGFPPYGPAASAAGPDPASADSPARANAGTTPAPERPQDSDRDHDRDREGDDGATMPLRPVHPAASLVALPEYPASGPREEDLGLFGTATPAAPEAPAGHGRRDPHGPGYPRADRRADRRQRRRRTVAVTATAVAVAAVCAGVLAAGLSGGSEESDRALPDETPRIPTAVLPTGDAWTGSGRPSAPASATGPTSATPTRSPSAVTSPASQAPEADRTADEGPETLDETPRPEPAPVLSKGMSGAEVLEMQRRLNQIGRSLKVEEDGQYNGNEVRAISRYQNMFGVEGDPQGVYGPATRSSLESRTQV